MGCAAASGVAPQLSTVAADASTEILLYRSADTNWKSGAACPRGPFISSLNCKEREMHLLSFSVFVYTAAWVHPTRERNFSFFELLASSQKKVAIVLGRRYLCSVEINKSVDTAIEKRRGRSVVQRRKNGF